MTELYINGIAAVLPLELNITIKRENPLFTKNGEYSYDITLDLTNPINAELYKHLNRVNSVEEIENDRTLIIIADNRVYCHGTEIITGWTDTSVTIQAASGNSEMNYFIGSHKKISELDLPNTSPFTNNIVNTDYATKLYPEIDFCLPTIYNSTSQTFVNEWQNKFTASDDIYLAGIDNYTEHDYQPQVFLCSFIKAILNALGYELTENVLSTSKWKDLYIVQLNYTTAWSKMMPGWTVEDFFKDVEHLFNCSFIIDSRNKKARLLFNNTYYLTAPVSFVKNVIDEYECELEDESVTLQNVNVRYNFPSTAYFRKRRLPDEISKSAKRGTIPSGTHPSTGRPYFSSWFRGEENQHKDVIYTNEENGREFIYSDDTYDQYRNWFYMINEFKDIIRDGASQTIDLNIMPVAFCIYTIPIPGGDRVRELWQIPQVDGESEDLSNEGNLSSTGDIIELLDNGISGSSGAKSPIFLAFHQGLNSRKFWGSRSSSPLFPISFADSLLWTLTNVSETNDEGASLRLVDLENELYSGIYRIDEKSPRTFVSHDSNVFDPRNIFLIQNKRWVCRDIEYTLTYQGRKSAWKGVFYPITISDTEADHRWILTDGKWRDGGVWLDNGRWLDE